VRGGKWSDRRGRGGGGWLVVWEGRVEEGVRRSGGG